MGLLQRLFSSEYRRALTAEASGDFLAAARSYALCGESQKVCDMHLADARRHSDLDERINALRNALGFAENDGCVLVQRLLAEALRRDGQRRGEDTREGRESLMEAGELLAEGQSFEAAGECFIAAKKVEAAIDAYSRAGQLEKVEELLATQERHTTRDRELHHHFSDYQLYMGGGRRDQALSELRACVEIAPRKGDYRRLLTDLEGQLLREDRVELHCDGRRLFVLGGDDLLVGRDGDCKLVVRGPSVSRRHARILFDKDNQRFQVADAGSRNGTLLDGLTIAGKLALPARARIGLGDRTWLAAEHLAGETLRLEVEGTSRDMGQRAIYIPLGRVLLQHGDDRFPPALLVFKGGRPWIETAGDDKLELELNGKRVLGAIQAIVGDEISINGRRILVVS